MQDSSPTAFIAQGPFRRMDELRRLLGGQGIEAQIVSPPGEKPGGG